MASHADETIAFVGGGNMAEALVRGLVTAGRAPDSIVVAEPVGKRRSLLKRRYRVRVAVSNVEAAVGATVVVLAVKPQVIDDVLSELAEHRRKLRLVMSIAAGVTIRRIEKALGGEARVVRTMPNTPCLVNRGASVVCAGRNARATDVRRARAILETVGRVFVVDRESLLDPVTGLSGSGPAYVYRFAEALIAGAVRQGLDAKLARELTYETLAGAAEMLIRTGRSPEELRHAVSSPGGTTLAGLARLDGGDFVGLVGAAVESATRRSRELGGHEA